MDLVAHLNIDCRSMSSGVVVHPFWLPRRCGALFSCVNKGGGEGTHLNSCGQ